MKTIITVLAILFIGVCSGQASHEDEINSLLTYLGGLEGAVFVRNGKPHTAKETQAHLKMKWQRQLKKIRSAEDFIKLCASKSYLSGKRYVIKMKDGSEKFSDDLLRAELKKIRKKAK